MNAVSSSPLRLREGRFSWAVCVLLLISLAALVPAATAQSNTGSSDDATVTGRVFDDETGTPLPSANVVLVGPQIGTTTDLEGRFELDDVPPGRYTLAISFLGYEGVRRTLELEPGETRSLTFRLVPIDLEVEGVTVTADRVDRRDLGVTKITPAEIQNLPTVLQPDLFRSLQLLPGIKAASDFSSGLYVRGGSPDQTLVLLDEAPIYNPTHVFGFFSTFNPDAVGDVSLYKGGYPVEYGGRLAAVVDIRTRRPSERDVSGGFGLGLLSSGGYVQGPIGTEGATPRGSWIAAARRSTLEPLFAALESANVEDIPTGFYFYDLNLAGTLQVTDRDVVRLSLYGGRDQLDYPFLSDAVFDISYGNRSATGSWQHILNDDVTVRTSGAVTQYYSDPIARLAGTEFLRDNDVFDLKGEVDVTWAASETHLVDGGVTLGSFTTRLRNSFDGNPGYSPRIRTTYGSVHAQDRYTPSWNDKLELTAGLRINWYAQGDFVRPAPRLRASYALNDRVTLQAGYGRFYQYLSAASSELFSAFDFWLTTDDGVPPSYGDQFLAGVKTQPREGVELDVELYYRTLRDLFDIDRLIQDYTGLDYADTFLFGDGEAYGVETTLRKTTGRVNGFIGYTLSRTTRQFDNFNGGASYSPKFDRTHDLTAVANYDFAENWRLTTVFTYATGQAYTEPTGTLKLLDSPFQSQAVTGFTVPSVNNARLPAYHRLDVGVKRKGSFFGVGTYEAQMQLVNAYGRRNVWFVLFQPEDDNTISRDVVPQIPVPLPNLSLTVTF